MSFVYAARIGFQPGAIYVLLGRTGSSGSKDDIREYYPPDRTWHTRGTVRAVVTPVGRDYAGAASVAAEIYFTGGQNSDGTDTLNWADVFSPPKETDTILDNMSDSDGRCMHSMGGVGLELFVFGGHSQTGSGSANTTVLTTAEKYELGTSSWSNITALAAARRGAPAWSVPTGHASAGVFILGGYTNNSTAVTNTILRYRVAENDYVSGLEPFTTARGRAQAFLLERGWVVAGESGSDTVRGYSFTADNWVTGAVYPLSGLRAAVGSASFNEGFVLSGSITGSGSGAATGGLGRKECYKYNEGDNAWTREIDYPAHGVYATCGGTV